jgi:mannan endo-1,4-beta-mannosidase
MIKKLLLNMGLASSLALSLVVSNACAAGFHVNGSKLQDANGNNFYPRGVSNPNIWFDSQAYAVLPNIAARHTNLVRVVWTTQGSASRLDQILSADEAQHMISMVELHDGTGSNDAVLLSNLASYWARSDVAKVLKKHERYLLINIANEWSNGSKTEAQWNADYKQPITIIRNAGLTTTIVIDNPGYAQNAKGGLYYGQDLLNHDPQHNLLFSIHMYSEWGNANDIYNAMSNYRNNNLALVIGEFGYNADNGKNNLGCTVNADLLMQYAQQFGVGYIAWSTQGNDAANAWLDLMTNWSGTTAWGNDVWYSQYGIYNTATAASVFSGGGGTPGFTLAPAETSLSVVPGKSSTDSITVGRVSGFTGNVTLAISGLPSGVTASFSPNPTAGTSVVTFTASSGATAGTSTLSVKGTSGTLAASVPLSLTVKAVATGGVACHVGYTVSNRWSGGFSGNLSIGNTGTTTLSNWTLAWTFANGQTVTQLWNGNESQSGSRVTVTSLSYNASLPAGSAYTGVGFNASWNNATNAVPTSFTLNGTACK